MLELNCITIRSRFLSSSIAEKVMTNYLFSYELLQVKLLNCEPVDRLTEYSE